MSTESRGNRCSRLTCKSSLCFKRVKDSLNEDLQLSTTYQNFMDDISDDSSDDLELSTKFQNLTTFDDYLNENIDSSECSGNDSTDTELVFSDFDEHFVNF